MAFSIDGLVDNITGSVQNLVNLLPGHTPQPPVAYPTDQGTVGNYLNTITQKNWNNLPQPYSFGVYDVYLKSFSTVDFGEFQLPIAPNKITQTEN